MDKNGEHFKSNPDIKSEMPDVIEDNNSLIPDNSKIIMGCSCNYQLVDLFNIYNEINKSTNTNIDECCKLFNERRDNYFRNHDTIYNDINNITYLEVEKVYLNLKSRYSFITIKEEFKMDNIIRNDIKIFDNGKLNEDIYDFRNIDSIYKFAQENNFCIKVYFGFSDNDISNNLRQEVLDIFYDDTNKARHMLINFLENYFKILGNKYQCLEWSILSDIIYKGDDLELDNTILKESFFRNILGDDYFIDILQIARKSLPNNTRIGYTEGNEYDIVTRTRIIEIINKIKDFELNNNITLLDFVGISGYYNDKMSSNDIENIYKDFASLGKDINILELNVLNLQDNQKSVFKNILNLAYIYNIYSINMLGANDKVVCDKYKGSTMVDENCIEKDFFNDFLYLFVNNANYIKEMPIGNVISMIGKSIGAYMSYELIHLFNKLSNKLISYDEKMAALDDYKKYITDNGNKFNLGDCDLTGLDYNDILVLMDDISNNITLLSINNIVKSFDESIDCNNFTINDNFNIDDDTSEYINNNKISVEISNLFCNDFKYPKNFDSYLENIYNKENRLLNQKEKNDILRDLVSNYLSSITSNLNSKNIKLESVIVLNNILNEHGSTRWWSENFGDDYYVTLFQIVNKQLTDNVQLAWVEDKLIEDKNKRDDFLSYIERIVKHDPFLISYIGSDIIIDNDFDMDKYDDFISEINNFCKHMMDNYGADIKFKVSNLSFECINNSNKLSIVKHILDSISTQYFVGSNIGNLLIFNSFSFIDGLGNKLLQEYDSYTRKIFDLLNYNMDYNMNGSILENNIIGILQQYHDKQMKAIVSCNNSYSETFVCNNNDSNKSQDFLQIESSVKHIAEVTKNITSTFPKTISIIQEATSMGCTSPIEYLNVVPLLYNARVVKNNINSIKNPLTDKDKLLFRKSNINNIGFSSYLTLTFIIVFFIIVFILCLLYYI